MLRSSAGGLLDGGCFSKERPKAGGALVISARIEDDLASPDQNQESIQSGVQPVIPIFEENPAAVSFHAG